jgi:hypothetical protein
MYMIYMYDIYDIYIHKYISGMEIILVNSYMIYIFTNKNI